jgi:hypothetical protein
VSQDPLGCGEALRRDVVLPSDLALDVTVLGRDQLENDPQEPPRGPRTPGTVGVARFDPAKVGESYRLRQLLVDLQGDLFVMSGSFGTGCIFSAGCARARFRRNALLTVVPTTSR